MMSTPLNEEKRWPDEEGELNKTPAQDITDKAIDMSVDLCDALIGGKVIRKIFKWPTRNKAWPGLMEFNNIMTSIILYTDGTAELRTSYGRRPLSMPDWNPRVHIEFLLFESDSAGIEVVHMGVLENSCANFFEIRESQLANPNEFERMVHYDVRLVGGRWGRC